VWEELGDKVDKEDKGTGRHGDAVRGVWGDKEYND